MKQTRRNITEALNRSTAATWLSGEIGAQAAETIAARARLLGTTLVNPGLLPDPEIQRMVVEKFETGYASGHQMGKAMLATGNLLSRWSATQTSLSTRAAVAMSNPANALSTWGEWLTQSTRVNLRLLSELGLVAAKTAEQSIKSVHRATAANARRLRSDTDT